MFDSEPQKFINQSISSTQHIVSNRTIYQGQSFLLRLVSRLLLELVFNLGFCFKDVKKDEMVITSFKAQTTKN